jgi:hypothetical protein
MELLQKKKIRPSNKTLIEKICLFSKTKKIQWRIEIFKIFLAALLTE